MKFYTVGGAVRDKIMGKQPKDVDYLVVGATPEEMVACGFVQVGADFPVFLKNGCEYALARTERKNGNGYHGFNVSFDTSITVEDDLSRRDLTINAIAYDDITGEFIDPFNGVQDINDKVLRHTSHAFSEDPLRVLRVARFAARYSDFTIHPSTMVLMKDIVNSGELLHLSRERVWIEFEKALQEDAAHIFIKVLFDCGALQQLMPAISIDLSDESSMPGFAQDLAGDNASVAEKFAVLTWYKTIEEIQAICEENRIPNNVRDTCINYHHFRRAGLIYFSYSNNISDAELICTMFDKVGVKFIPNLISLFKSSTQYKYMDQLKCPLQWVYAIERAIPVYSDISFSSLPGTLQKTLKGAAIGAAIHKTRVFFIRETLSGNFNI